MVSQVVESTVDQLRSVSHIVTVVNPSAGEEASLTVRTFTGSLAEVLAATRVARKAQGLFGYEYFESLPS